MAKGDRHLPRSCNRATQWAIVGAMDEGTVLRSARRSDGPVARLAIAAVAIAACRSESKPAPALTRTAAPAAVAIDAAAAPDASAMPDAGATSPSLTSCPPSAYRNDGRSIMSIIPFVFPGCPSPELDLEEVYCAGCARPCGWQRVTAIDGHALPGSAVRAYYDDAGRLAQLSTDPLRQHFDYDARGALQAWHQGDSIYTITRDDDGRITQVRRRLPPPDRDEIWTFVYDDAGRVIESIDPYGSHLGFVYDAAGRQITEDDAGDRATFRYDAAGRLVFRDTTWQDTLTYDAAGRLATITSGTTARKSVFNYVADRLVTVVETGEQGRAVTTTTYDYDCAP